MTDDGPIAPRSNLFSRASAACYALWGAIHVGVGATVLAQLGGGDPAGGLRVLVDARPETTPAALTPAVAALAGQHGWNLVWIGGFTAATAWAVGRNRPYGHALAFSLAGLADVGYLAAFVAPGLVKPQTWIGGPTLWLAGALLSALALRAAPRHDATLAAVRA